MDCRVCRRRAECTQICPELESYLAQFTRTGREVLVDPGAIPRVAHYSGLTLADMVPDRSWMWDRLAGCLGALSITELRPFLLHFYDGKSVPQVARELGVHRSTINRRLNRALIVMRREADRRGLRPPQYEQLHEKEESFFHSAADERE